MRRDLYAFRSFVLESYHVCGLVMLDQVSNIGLGMNQELHSFSEGPHAVGLQEGEWDGCSPSSWQEGLKCRELARVPSQLL